VELLFKAIENPTALPEKVILPVELKIRKSTAPPPR
jgi:DNA-binding LacI/PurR family transcriptional regulator